MAECPDPFVTNSDSICVCPEGLTGSNCEIGECHCFILIRLGSFLLQL